MSKTVPEILREKAELFEEKGKQYGHSYLQYGEVMKALFPGGLPAIKSQRDWNMFGIYSMMVHKMLRLANMNFESTDSIKDLQVYAAMLEEIVNGEEN
jgi:hypothetical protein